METNVAVWKVALLSQIATSLGFQRYRTFRVSKMKSDYIKDKKKANLEIVILRDVLEQKLQDVVGFFR